MKLVHCDTCRHRRAPRGAPRISGSAGSAQAFNVQSELRSIWQARGHSEDAEISMDRPIVTQPRTKPWCTRYTLSTDETDEIRRRIVLGDVALAKSVEERGLVVRDAVQGVIRTFAICTVQNRELDCTSWKALR